MRAHGTPYSTLEGMFEITPPVWIPDPLDQLRIQSYQVYEHLYWSVPTALKLSLRGTEDKPIYVPSARTIIEATNRHLAPEFLVTPVDRQERGETESVRAANLVLTDLFNRERFKSKFNAAKRFSLIQGDWIWHVKADADKELGSRISMKALDPSLYFPVFDEEDIEKIVAVHLAYTVNTPTGASLVRRQTYRKVFDGKRVIGITVEDGLFDPEKWFPLDSPPVKEASFSRPQTPLPGPITTIPVYHIRNFEESGNPFGSSELRGLERLVTAINQTITDEELSLALEGIGMYATTADQPIDPETGQKVPWRLGPGRVVHHPEGTDWKRVGGVSSVTPYGDHYDRLWSGLKQGSSTPDIAIGSVDVASAESGVALALKLAPIVSKTAEKGQIIRDVHTQMGFDLLNQWYPAYEETTFDSVTVNCSLGSAIPVDRKAKFEELNWMLDKGVIDTLYYRDEVKKLGYEFPEDIGTRVDVEREKIRDEFGARLGTELGSDDV